MLITLDLDGVLMKNPFSTAVFPSITKQLGEGPNLSHKDVMKLILDEVRARAKRGDYVGAYDWDQIVAVVGERLGFKGSIDVAALVRENCTPKHIHSYPGVHDTLCKLRRDGHVLIALTNGFAKYQRPVLEALDLMQFLHGIYTPEVSGFAKPDAEFFAAVRRDFDMQHIHVGDTVAHDLWGANKSGAMSVWVYHDLPQDIQELPLAQRSTHPSLPTLIEAALAKDIMSGGYQDLNIEDCLPDFVMANISDLVEAVHLAADMR